jgi:hypothetical protein
VAAVPFACLLLALAPSVTAELTTEYLEAARGARPAGFESISDLRPSISLGPGSATSAGRWMVGVDSAVGRVTSGEILYSADLRAGLALEQPSTRRLAVGASVGAGVDGVGRVVAEALTVPVDLFLKLDVATDPLDRGLQAPPLRGLRLQLRGRGERVLTGRPPELLWSAYLDVVSFDRTTSHGELDLIVSATARRYVGTTYVGLAFGVGLRGYALMDSDQ